MKGTRFPFNPPHPIITFLALASVLFGKRNRVPPNPNFDPFVVATTTVSANASDNVGVAGVQFKLDGANLGAEDTTSPYSVSWNTTTASNGSHTLTVVARSAKGNSTTTNVTFAVPGTYVLRLTASDGALSSSDHVIVTVNAL